MLAAAAAVAAGSHRFAVAEENKPEGAKNASPNEKLGVAVVGVRGRGGEHLSAFSSRKDTEVLWIVDADSNVGNVRVDEVARRQGRKPKFTQDMREAFADPSVDIVSTATPNHWHALVSIWAMQHGKDVYVEKPVSHNVSEGRRIVETARKYNRICQTGTQCRSTQGTRQAMEYLHANRLGPVSVARGLCYKRRPSIGPRGQYQAPSTVNYDIWLGPAPLADVTRPQFHYDWHWQWPYGNGDLGNQGIHQMDLARWGLGATALPSAVLSYGGRLGYEDAGDTANTQVVIHDYGDKTLIFEVRGLQTEPYKTANVGVIFEAANGYLVLSSYDTGVAFNKEGQMVEKFAGGGDHFDNFVKAVRSRNSADLNADILEGHLSSALCHLGNVSYRLGSPTSVPEVKERVAGLKIKDDARDTFDRTMQHLADNKVDLAQAKLQWGAWLAIDPSQEKFVDNAAANARLTREYRAPFVVPAAGQV
jgi:predicted dehydrogenase